MKTEKFVVVDFTVQDVTIHIYNIDPDIEVIKHKGTILK